MVHGPTSLTSGQFVDISIRIMREVSLHLVFIRIITTVYGSGLDLILLYGLYTNKLTRPRRHQ